MSPAIATLPARTGQFSSTEELADALAGLSWWNRIAEPERAYWMQQAGSAVPADAWEEYKAREVRQLGRKAPELERQVRGYFEVALESAVEATFEEVKRRDLGHVTIDVLAGIMRRSLADARLRFGWL